MKIIDIESWDRAKSYKWFSSFSNPTYAVSAKINITKLINYVKRNGLHFYEHMLYLVVHAINKVPQMRLRVYKGNVCEYETPAVSFTVAADNGSFDICCLKWNNDSSAFCSETRKNIENVKRGKTTRELGDSDPDVYYFSSLPWLDFTRMSDPIPDDVTSLSIPRICWGKYVETEKGYELNLNITVNHALVDGKHVCDAFNEIQSAIDNCENIFKKEK